MTPFSGPSQRSCESRRQPAPEAGEVARDVLERAADDEVAERVESPRRTFVAAADRERQSVAFEGAVGLQNDVGRRVVRIGVHGVGAVQPCATSENADRRDSMIANLTSMVTCRRRAGATWSSATAATMMPPVTIC